MRKKYAVILFISSLAILFRFGTVQAQNHDFNPRIGAESAKILKKMDAHLTANPKFTLVVDTIDEQLSPDGKVQKVERRINLIVRRPDRLKGIVKFKSPPREREFYYNGKTITLWDKTDKVYAQVEAPDTVDKALDFAMERLGVTMPLIDFVFNNLYENLTQQVISSDYLGLTNVSGHDCHLLTFHQESIDWYLWIQDGDRPIPRKFMIIYKDEPERSKFVANFVEAAPLIDIADDIFEFVPPQDTIQIDFIMVDDEPEASDE